LEALYVFLEIGIERCKLRKEILRKGWFYTILIGMIRAVSLLFTDMSAWLHHGQNDRYFKYEYWIRYVLSAALTVIILYFEWPEENCKPRWMDPDCKEDPHQPDNTCLVSTDCSYPTRWLLTHAAAFALQMCSYFMYREYISSTDFTETDVFNHTVKEATPWEEEWEWEEGSDENPNSETKIFQSPAVHTLAEQRLLRNQASNTLTYPGLSPGVQVLHQ